jgi:hypothetical protein
MIKTREEENGITIANELQNVELQISLRFLFFTEPLANY